MNLDRRRVFADDFVTKLFLAVRRHTGSASSQLLRDLVLAIGADKDMAALYAECVFKQASDKPMMPDFRKALQNVVSVSQMTEKAQRSHKGRV